MHMSHNEEWHGSDSRIDRNTNDIAQRNVYEKIKAKLTW